MKPLATFLLLFVGMFYANSQSCTVNLGNGETVVWRTASWSCTGGMPAPTGPGPYTGNIIVNFSNNSNLVIDQTVRLIGSIDLNGNSNSNLTVNQDDSLLVDGSVGDNNFNNIRYQIDGVLSATGTIAGKNGQVFNGTGTVSAGAISLGNASCGPDGCPALLTDDCSANGNFCATNIAPAPPNPLPVDLISFQAIPNQDNVVLVWVTASEINNDRFTIQKSKSGEFFEILDEVEGQGTKNTPTEYTYKDQNPYSGLSFYRLKQTDFNGDFSITDAIAVNFSGSSDFQVEVFPNPINGHNLYLKIPTTEGEEFEVFVNDLLGRDYISDLTFINQNEFTLVIIELNSDLPAGVYFVNIVNQGKVTSKKVLVK